MKEASFKIFGLKEKEINKCVNDLEFSDTEVKVSESCYDSKVTIKYNGKDEIAFNDVISKFIDKFSENIYSDEDKSLQKVVAELLFFHNIRVAVAESLTGGQIAARLIEIPGISKVFYEGIVAYDNASKVRRLHVPISDIESFGAVSEQVSTKMVKGLLENKDIDIALSTTGIAGPSADGTSKPIGLVYISVSSDKNCVTERNVFSGNREEIRTASSNAALFYLIKFIKNIYTK